jgi:HlyD family secretion protein
MKRALLIIIAGLGLGVIGWFVVPSGTWSSLLGRPGTGGSDSSSKPRDDAGQHREVRAMGRLEPAGGAIDIAALVGDRLSSIEVKEGDAVTKGQTLAYLESRDLRKLEWESAESQLKEAKARATAEGKLADARVVGADLAVKRAETTDLDIEVQQEKVKLAKANLQLARKDLSRLEDLRKERKDLVSDQEHERQELVVQQAEAELSAADAMLKKLTRTRKLSMEAAQADLAAAQASRDQVLSSIPVESLEKRRDLARKQYEQTEIVAPSGGIVLKIFMRPGETIAQRPILQLANPSSMVVVAEVYETDVKRVKPGQVARITSKAFSGPYDDAGLRGTVDRIAKMITPPELRSLDPTARADRRVVEVRILLDPENSKPAANLANLQVDVEILPGGEAHGASKPPSTKETD